MRKAFLFFTVLAFPLVIKADGWEPKKLIVTGHVLNLDKHPDHRTLSLNLHDLLDRRKNYVTDIRADGTFKKEIVIEYAQELYLDYGTLGTLLCRPGDSLYVTVDADIWNDTRNKKPNGNYFIAVAGGTAWP